MQCIKSSIKMETVENPFGVRFIDVIFD